MNSQIQFALQVEGKLQILREKETREAKQDLKCWQTHYMATSHRETYDLMHKHCPNYLYVQS